MVLTGTGGARNRSHTTALKDRLPEDKNRGLDTQAPITMGEEDEEQTGHPGKNVGDQHDKPKYKRQEFMRPKYGAVNFDVIDAVNARLAAASGTTDLFSKLRIETSFDNEKKIGDVEATFQLPATAAKPNQEITNTTTHQKRHKTVPPTASKSNRSLTLSNGKRYNKKPNNFNSTTEQTYAQAESDAGLSSHLKAPTIVSRWHGSFDETCDGEHDANIDGLHIEKSENSTSRRSPLLYDNSRHSSTRPYYRSSLQPLTKTSESKNWQPPSSSYNVRLFTTAATAAPTSASVPSPTSSAPPPVAAPPQISVTPPVAQTYFSTPQTTSSAKVVQPAPSMVPTTAALQSASNTLMMHFKNLVSSFNALGNSSSSQVRQSASRGTSLENAFSPHFHSASAKFSTAEKRMSVANDAKAVQNAAIDHEKELRRQRRMRRRSDCQGMFPQAEVSSKLPTVGDIITGNNTVQKSTNVLNSNGFNAVKKSSSEIRLLNNGNEVLPSSEHNQALKDTKEHIMSLRRKRYQFLGFTPPTRTATTS